MPKDNRTTDLNESENQKEKIYSDYQDQIINRVIQRIESGSERNTDFPGWEEYGRYVLKQLETFETEIKELHVELNDVRRVTDIIKTKVAFYAGLVGFAASLIPIIIQLVIFLIGVL